MSSSAKKAKCREIIARLANDFQAKYATELKKEAASTSSDFIRRGLGNCTARVSAVLALHYEYARRLAEFLVQALEKDYAHLRPSICETELTKIIENEYGSIRRKVPGWLQESSLLANPEILASYEQGVTQKAEQAKKSIANACILWEERWKAQRQKKRNHLLKWAAGILLTAIVCPIGVTLVIGRMQGRSHPSELQRNMRADPNTSRTPLFVRTKGRVKEREDYLIKEKVHPWLFMWPESSVKVELHDGTDYSYAGLEYGGSVVSVFWKSLDPFLEDTVRQVLDEVGKECQSNGINPSAPLTEAGWLLESMITRVYQEMAEVDQKLRGRRDRKSVPRTEVEWRIKPMTEKVREHVKAAVALYSASPD
ncbi:MAG: hypothetical protein A2Y77_02690 [Planctomycetes bacterium RBG_13_62_9]|nr:MAG: hypothetical protein A2Y77_02690 [Planctomycetes bacterium RBG_13_62_9]